MITKYGFNTFAVMCLLAFALLVAGVYVSPIVVRISLISVGLFLFFFSLNFFRDPERKTPTRADIGVSPADGKIIVIKRVVENKFIGGEAVQISIFMSPLNVHVNRIPLSGRVEYFNYIKGKYIAAFEDKASEENERCEVGITTPKGKILFTQIAGYVARRIVNPLKVGDEVRIGERFGMIKFGSRVDVLIPAHWHSDVRVGDVVTAGETILFEIN